MRCKTLLLILLFLSGFLSVSARRWVEQVAVSFPLNGVVIEEAYGDNAAQLQRLHRLLDSIGSRTGVQCVSVRLVGMSSPDGHAGQNRQLSARRLQALEKVVGAMPAAKVERKTDNIAWATVARMVAASDMPAARRLAGIMLDVPERGVKQELVALDDGRSWHEMDARFLAGMRMAYVQFTLDDRYKRNAKPVAKAVKPRSREIKTRKVSKYSLSMPPQWVAPAGSGGWWHYGLSVKTNAVAWAFFVQNLTIEGDLAPHWSLQVPVYYSALDYFTETLKLRTICLQPGLRYWFQSRRGNDGWFLGAHFGVAWYNVAMGGDVRIQDHDGRTPALGGGLSAGWRMPLGDSRNWFVEFSLGAGVYGVHYDLFRNGRNGAWLGEKKTVFAGIDHAAVSFAYRFNWPRR